ncbi:MAG: sodium/glutamate symporter, partial [Thermodesulfobacteriota bacterium]|nr:sodium/glutamate symporter [Thermodesulfobacteriota bacterium]
MIVDPAGPVPTIVTAQFVIAALLTIFVVFKIMGWSYEAAVLCSGFGGLSLES